MKIRWEQTAYRALRKLDVKAGLSILHAVADLAADPYPNASKKLVDRPGRRLRVGDYRVVYSVADDLVSIHEVGHRREICD